MLPLPLPRYEVNAVIVSQETTRDQTYTLTLYTPEIAQAAQPGQFLELHYGDGFDPLLCRPFSLYGVDRAAGTCQILYRVHGPFTSHLCQKRAGEIVSLLGPLGTPYRWSPVPGSRHFLIAGGIGAPPISFLATEMSRAFVQKNLDAASLVVINAARTAKLLLGMALFESLPLELITITDDGTHGRRGLAPELLTALLDENPDQPACIYACGPMPMLRALCEIACTRALPCQVSVETSMPCGIGTCQGCVVPVRDASASTGFRYARACYEGPVFEASDLLWK